jgi:methyl-accepting chemotaxis protein
MDTVVQMNASLVEEATAAATSMASQATGLARAVAQFRIDDAGTPAQPAAIAGVLRRTHPPETASERRAAVTSRREPLLTAAAAEDEEWKEF